MAILNVFYRFEDEYSCVSCSAYWVINHFSVAKTENRIFSPLLIFSFLSIFLFRLLSTSHFYHYRFLPNSFQLIGHEFAVRI